MINASVFAKSIGPKSPDEPMLEKAPISKNDVTSLACYIKKGDKVKWLWALDDDNNYYPLEGKWKKTKYTKLEKFMIQSPSTSKDSLLKKCRNAITYWRYTGYDVFAAFAAQKRISSNYPIVLRGTELYPLL